MLKKMKEIKKVYNNIILGNSFIGRLYYIGIRYNTHADFCKNIDW